MADRLKSMDETFLECRYTRHAWKHMGFYRYNRQLVSVLECRDCDAIREQILTSGAEIKRNSYTYPEGYVEKGSRRISAIDVRKEMLRRSTIFTNYDEFAERLT